MSLTKHFEGVRWRMHRHDRKRSNGHYEKFPYAKNIFAHRYCHPTQTNRRWTRESTSVPSTQSRILNLGSLCIAMIWPLNSAGKNVVYIFLAFCCTHMRFGADLVCTVVFSVACFQGLPLYKVARYCLGWLCPGDYCVHRMGWGPLTGWHLHLETTVSQCCRLSVISQDFRNDVISTAYVVSGWGCYLQVTKT